MADVNVLKDITSRFQDVVDTILKRSQSEYVYIYDTYKIVILKLTQRLLPKGIKINETAFVKLSDENLQILIEILPKKFSIEIFRYFDSVAEDLYKMFEVLRANIPSAIYEKTKDESIKKVIIDNLVATALTAQSMRNMIVAKTNGMLETFRIHIMDIRLKDEEVFKQEISSLFTDFYLKYLQLLKIQKKIILKKLSE